jgi:GNAT superfamily N-acetyltransferase
MTSLEGWGSTIELHPRARTSGVPSANTRGQYGRMPIPPGANQHDTYRRSEPSSGGRPKVRPAGLGDAGTLAQINVLAWQRAYAGIVPAVYLEALQVTTMHERWIARIQDPGDRISLVAEVDGRVAAYAIAGSYRIQHDAEPEDTAGWGELYAIYAHPDLQGRGAGLAVHDAALAALAERRNEVAALWVLRDNIGTQRWYDRRGWRPDGASSRWLGAGLPLEEIRLTRRTNGSFGDRSSRLGR